MATDLLFLGRGREREEEREREGERRAEPFKEECGERAHSRLSAVRLGT